MSPALSRVVRMGVIAAVLASCGRPTNRPTRPDPARSGPLVTQEDIERHPNETLEGLLQRKVPGVVVRRTRTGGIALQIRGSTSYDGSDARPLYVLNDFPIEPGPDGSLPFIDVRDILDIKVLKGAETALYGIRALHGVIVIRTRQ